MAIKRFYSIQYADGTTEIINDYWNNISHKVQGIDGILYKSHNQIEEAKEWLNLCKKTISHNPNNIKQDQLYLYVDGSFNKKVGWGWVAVLNDKNIGENYGWIESLEGGRNVVGELKATMESVSWAFKKNDYKSAIVVHDYQGISAWAIGQWFAKKKYNAAYASWIFKYIDKLTFEKCNGHAGVYWNEYADKMASLGLKEFEK